MSIIQTEQVMQTHPASARLPHDEKYDKCAIFLNGKYCTFDDAKISLFEYGFIQSDVTYEVATVARGRVFRLRDHFLRFAHACDIFRLHCPYSEEEMIEIFTKLVGFTGVRDGHLLWCLTRGFPKPGGNATRDRNNPEAWENRFYASAAPYYAMVTQEQRNRGLDIAISKKYIRVPPAAIDPTAKSYHWMDMKLALFEARDLGKEWSVLTDSEGYLTECPGANIFVVKDGALYTPDSGCLEGITRKAVIELAEMTGVPVHVEKVHATQLKQADDAFMTSSAGGVMPINSVDDIVLGGRAGPGELAVRFHNLYWEKLWEGWKCMPISDVNTRSAP